MQGKKHCGGVYTTEEQAQQAAIATYNLRHPEAQITATGAPVSAAASEECRCLQHHVQSVTLAMQSQLRFHPSSIKRHVEMPGRDAALY